MIRSLACLGDSGDIGTWSSTPYFLFKAAHRAGFLTHTLDLLDPKYKAKRKAWLLRSPLRLEWPGGYQFSRSSARRMWDQLPADLREGEIISHFHLFPPIEDARMAGVRHSFYVDRTLQDLFDTGEAARIGRRTLRDALRREGELYRSARFFIGMSRVAVESAIRDYGVDRARAYVVRPGANLDETAVQEFLAARGPSWRERAEPFTRDRPAVLGFIGMDWRRKGLARLVDAAAELVHRGKPAKVAVIGNCPERLRGHPQVQWLGVVRKVTDVQRFLEAVETFAVGCLPSYSEPLGISTLETLRLGVPVMGTAVGGIPDCIPDTAGFLVPAGANAAQIADSMERNLFDPARYAMLVRGALAESANVTWDRTARQLMRIWSGSEPAWPAARKLQDTTAP